MRKHHVKITNLDNGFIKACYSCKGINVEVTETTMDSINYCVVCGEKFIKKGVKKHVSKN